MAWMAHSNTNGYNNNNSNDSTKRNEQCYLWCIMDSIYNIMFILFWKKENLK